MNNGSGRVSWIKNLIKALAFILIFAVLYSCVDFVFREKKISHAEFMVPFYDEPADSIDVVIIGGSHSYCSMNPAQLYEDYGIASYSFSESGEHVAWSYYMTQEAINVQHPDLIVLDCYVSFTDPYDFNLVNLRRHTDNMRDPFIRAQMINEFVPEDQRENFFIPLIKYHSRWNELTKDDFSYPVDYFKGAYPYNTCEKIDPVVPVPKDEKTVLSEISMDYIRKTIELCKANGTDVLLIATPFNVGYDALNIDYTEMAKNINAVYDIAEEYDVNYLNMFYELDKLNLDYNYDFADTGHVSMNGSKKVSALVGEYIKSNYEIPDRRNDENYSSWDDYCKVSDQVFNSRFLDMVQKQYQNALDVSLDCLNYDNYLVCVADMGSGITSDERFVEKLNEIGSEISEGEYPDGYIGIFDGGRRVLESSNKNSDVSYKAEALDGMPIFTLTTQGRFSCSVNGKDVHINREGVSIIVYDKTMEDFVFYKGFTQQEVNDYIALRNAVKNEKLSDYLSAVNDLSGYMVWVASPDSGRLLSVNEELAAFGSELTLADGESMYGVYDSDSGLVRERLSDSVSWTVNTYNTDITIKADESGSSIRFNYTEYTSEDAGTVVVLFNKKTSLVEDVRYYS